jgi:hypothetical protein
VYIGGTPVSAIVILIGCTSVPSIAAAPVALVAAPVAPAAALAATPVSTGTATPGLSSQQG